MATATAAPQYNTITPYLIATGADRLIEFMKATFGAEERSRHLTPDGRIMHAEVRIGDSVLAISDGSPEYPSRPTALHVYVRDPDAAYRKAIELGAISLKEPVNQEYGDREASIRDFAGNNWYIAAHLAKDPGQEPGREHIPGSLRTVTPYLHPIGAPKLIAFLKDALGAEELEVYHAPEPDGPIVHAKIRIGDSVIELGEAHGEWQPMPPGLWVHVQDADAAYERAVKAGAESVSPPHDEPYGERSSTVKDPAGNTWFLNAPLSK